MAAHPTGMTLLHVDDNPEYLDLTATALDRLTTDCSIITEAHRNLTPEEPEYSSTNPGNRTPYHTECRNDTNPRAQPH